MIAILSPLQEECKSLRPYLEVDRTVYLGHGVIWHGRVGTREVIVARCGLGAEAMRKAAQFCVDHLKATQLILLGFGGATTPQAHVGDLIVATEIIDGKDSTCWPSPSAERQEALTLCQQSNLPAYEGRIVMMHDLVPSPHEKAFLGTRHQTTAVDMESAALAAVGNASGVSWMVIRAIVDTMDMPLFEEVECVNADGTVAIGAVVKHLMRHPRVIPQLSRLHFATIKAREHLTSFAKAWIAHR